MNEDAISRGVREICKLAEAHQSGAGLKDVKLKVNLIINDVGRSAGSDLQRKKSAWAALLSALDGFASATIDYRWKVVIRHARQRVKIRLYSPPDAAGTGPSTSVPGQALRPG